MTTFIFDGYDFNDETRVATFRYRFDDGRSFVETVAFAKSATSYNEQVLENALFLAFVLIGTSYYKTFPTTHVRLGPSIDEWQAAFFNSVYQDGMSQFAFENNLSRRDLAHFHHADHSDHGSNPYQGSGVLVLQSGGKDSLLLAALLEDRGISYVPWYLSSSDQHPDVLDRLNHELLVAKRSIDHDGLSVAHADGAKNGHVPITYIVQALALVHAVLCNKQQVLVSIAHEGEEPYAHIDDVAVRHQWSKTWQSEQQFAEYVQRYVSADIDIGSPLRQYSELKVAELFAKTAWDRFGKYFSSCNIANYQQGIDNTTLRWCGHCPKCANSYVLFAPFVSAPELQALFGGQDLFIKPELTDIFKGLLSIDNTTRPFECIGETDELRTAYHMSQERRGYDALPFAVSAASFDWNMLYPAQAWATEMLQ